MGAAGRISLWVRVGVAALIVCLGLAAGRAAKASDVDQARLAQAIEFRSAFGLIADVDYVASVIANAPNMEWGVALTDVEAKDLSNRERIVSERGPLLEVAEAAPEFAGFYTDQTRGGVLVVRLTKQDPGLLARIQSAVPDGAQLEGGAG